jgi:hypothetical protein
MLPPKNGCMTLESIFNKVHDIDVIALDTKQHYTLESFAIKYPNYDLFGFKFYGFYRNPIDRFLSAYEHAKWHPELAYIQNILYKKITPEPLTMLQNLRGGPALFTSDFKPLRVTQYFDCLPEIEYIQNNSYNQKLNTFTTQKSYLDIPNITLLDFNNFDQEVINLLTNFEYDFTIDVNSVPKKNAAEDRVVTKDTLTQIEIDLIKNKYSEDYEFFESKGITFID